MNVYISVSYFSMSKNISMEVNHGGSPKIKRNPIISTLYQHFWILFRTLFKPIFRPKFLDADRAKKTKNSDI